MAEMLVAWQVARMSEAKSGDARCFVGSPTNAKAILIGLSASLASARRGIDDVLVNEAGIRVGKRVVRQLVVLFLLAHRS
jgi:hypothetical protein